MDSRVATLFSQVREAFPLAQAIGSCIIIGESGLNRSSSPWLATMPRITIGMVKPTGPSEVNGAGISASPVAVIICTVATVVES